MPRKAQFDWDKIRLEYETGSTMGELSRRYGVSKPTISIKAKKEGWIQDVSATVARIVEAKANGITNTVDPVRKAEAINAAVDARLSIIEIHKKQWERHRIQIESAIDEMNIDAAKLAETTARAIEIVQKGERRAWGIDKNESAAPVADPVKELFQEIAAMERGRRLPDKPQTESENGGTTDKT